MNHFYILTFNNTHEAMKAESVCLGLKLKVTMMPTPTYITKSCGISLRIGQNDFEPLKGLVQDNKFTYKGIFELKENVLKQVEL
jgi:Protein of unknown function (DUF3343)